MDLDSLTKYIAGAVVGAAVGGAVMLFAGEHFYAPSRVQLDSTTNYNKVIIHNPMGRQYIFFSQVKKPVQQEERREPAAPQSTNYLPMTSLRR